LRLIYHNQRYSFSILHIGLKNYFVSFILLFACEWLPHRRLLRSPDLPLQPDQGFDMGPGVHPTPGLLPIPPPDATGS
jgi:hypothetical protein